MTQHTDIALPQLTYNHSDYTALSAYVLKTPLQRVVGLYYTDDTQQLKPGLERWLLDMPACPIERGTERNHALTQALYTTRQGCSITTEAFDVLIRVADLPRPASIRRAIRHV